MSPLQTIAEDAVAEQFWHTQDATKKRQLPQFLPQKSEGYDAMLLAVDSQYMLQLARVRRNKARYTGRPIIIAAPATTRPLQPQRSSSSITHLQMDGRTPLTHTPIPLIAPPMTWQMQHGRPMHTAGAKAERATLGFSPLPRSPVLNTPAHKTPVRPPPIGRNGFVSSITIAGSSPLAKSTSVSKSHSAAINDLLFSARPVPRPSDLFARVGKGANTSDGFQGYATGISISTRETVPKSKWEVGVASKTSFHPVASTGRQVVYVDSA